jgi:DNA-binding MarR family transcriptional regulator
VQNATKSHRSDSAEAGPATQELVEALRDVFLALRRTSSMDHRDKAAMGLLAHLIELGPTRISDLAERAYLSNSTVSRHVAELEEAGYVTRVPDASDKRAVALKVTRSGKSHFEQTKKQHIKHLQEAVDSWSTEELNTMATLLRRLASDLENR